MSTVYDNPPVPEPSNAEINAFSDIHLDFMKALHKRFGQSRTMVLLDWYCITNIAEAICNGWERRRGYRVMEDLNEALRQEQVENRAGDDDDGRYWMLVPTKEP